MLLRDLLARPELRLRLLHGDAGALERPLRGVCTTDLLDPGRYLSGGELVVSGLVWRAGAADSDAFAAALARAGAAALAAGEAVFHGVPDDVVEACRRHGVPLVAVPEEVSFAAVTDLVVGRAGTARGDRLARMLGRQRGLLDALAGGMGLDGLVARVPGARVLTASGRVVAGPAPADLDAVVAAFLTADRLPARAGGTAVHAVGPAGPDDGRLTSWCVAVDGPAAPAGAADPAAEDVEELVAVAAVERARRLADGQALARSIADDAVALVAAGAPDRRELAIRLRQAGLDPDAALTPVVATVAADRDPARDPGRDPGLARSVLADVTAHAGPAAVGVHGGRAVALVACGAAGTTAVRTALHRLRPGLARAGDRRAVVGIGRAAPLTALAGALREADHAHDVAAARPGVLAIVTADELSSHVALLAAVPDDVRRAFAARVLGPLLAPAGARADLLGTLETHLACGGSWSRTADRLHLHVNTVRYRIRQVERLLGRDLTDPDDRVDVHLALRCR